MIKGIVFLSFFATCILNSNWVNAGTFDDQEAQFADQLQSHLESIEPSKGESNQDESFWNFSRIQVLTGGFAEIDLKVIELKIQPYVELRFNSK